MKKIYIDLLYNSELEIVEYRFFTALRLFRIPSVLRRTSVKHRIFCICFFGVYHAIFLSYAVTEGYAEHREASVT